MAKKGFRGLFRASGTATLFTLLFMMALMFYVISCTPQQVFGDLLICGDVDSRTFEPVGIDGTYNIDSPQIVAAIKISGVRGGDRWRFTWRNAHTGEVIADSANTYSHNGSSFIEGYLSNKLLPAEGSDIIAEPGDYTVSYYHNGELVETSDFTILRPESNILEVGFFKEISEGGQPLQEAVDFYQTDDIYAALRLDYRLSGDTFSIKWFHDEVLLGEEGYTIEEDSYKPGYIIFQLVTKDENPFPVSSYRLKVFHSGEEQGEFSFNVVPLEYCKEIFAGGAVYEDEGSGFKVAYPDGWSWDGQDIEAGSKIKFTPGDGIRQIIINMWILKEEYSPSPQGYSGFADELLAEQEGRAEDADIEKTESEEILGETSVYEVRYDNIDEKGGGWSITFSFLKKEDLLFLFMRLTDKAYIDYGESVVDYMIGSIRLNG